VPNPMITGVFAVLLGESILFNSMAAFFWFVFAVVINCVYIPLSEEPGLERRFGVSYLTYKRNVPRWIPQLQSWEGER
jgi:protein-S-isoprenylcysteine O-methyltransferase Ste14